MTAVDWFGLAALAAVLAVFYLVRRIPRYLGACFAVTIGFMAATFPRVEWAHPARWVVMTLGLGLCVFGLLIVRVMLIRSVSLRLLASIQGEAPESVGEDIGGRLHDMRAFRLIDIGDGEVTLTAFGKTIAAFVAAFYSIFRIET